MSFKKLLQEDRRFLILKALQVSKGYRSSLLLLQRFLDSFGQNVSHDVVNGEVAWLEDQGLVKAERSETIIVSLTTSGQDVATGRNVYPGVRVPTPDELDG